MTIPMIPSDSIAGNLPTICGGPSLAAQRIYTPHTGIVVKVLEGDDVQLADRGWLRIPSFGNTASRPTGNQTPGVLYVDTQAGKTLIFDGRIWFDVVTGNAV